MIDSALTFEAVIGANVPFAFRRGIRTRNPNAEIGSRGGRGGLDGRADGRRSNLRQRDACYKNQGKENSRAVEKLVTNACERAIKTEREVSRRGPQSSNVAQLLTTMRGQCHEL